MTIYASDLILEIRESYIQLASINAWEKECKDVQEAKQMAKKHQEAIQSLADELQIQAIKIMIAIPDAPDAWFLPHPGTCRRIKNKVIFSGPKFLYESLVSELRVAANRLIATEMSSEQTAPLKKLEALERAITFKDSLNPATNKPYSWNQATKYFNDLHPEAQYTKDGFRSAYTRLNPKRKK